MTGFVLSALRNRILYVTIHWNEPLTLPLSPSDGERETLSLPREQLPFGDRTQPVPVFSLSPSDGERTPRTDCSRFVPMNLPSEFVLVPRPSSSSSIFWLRDGFEDEDEGRGRGREQLVEDRFMERVGVRGLFDCIVTAKPEAQAED